MKNVAVGFVRAVGLEDVLAACGVAALSAGAALIYLPAGLLMLGMLLLVLALGLVTVKSRRPQ